MQVAFEHAHAVVVLQRTQRADAQLAAGGKAFDVAAEVARAEEEAQLHRPPGLARLAAGVGGDALGHQLDADPGRQAAVGLAEQPARAHAQAGLDAVRVEAQDLVDEDHVAGMGQQFGDRPRDHDGVPRISDRLLPPKAKELLIR
ncbi:hypothetical protein I0E98_07210 [Pseudomonas lalucatii]|nr:hypothetical protein [Pseudomonas lalucatii]